MKIKKVAKICRHRKRVLLHRTGSSGQYIGDGTAIYTAFDLPALDPENILAIFDIKPADRPKWDVEVLPTEGVSLADAVPGEKPVERFPFPFVYGGQVIFPIMTSRGVIFIDNEYLEPVTDAPHGVELYERHGGVGTYIAVKAGLDLVAVILPVDVVDPAFMDRLSILTNACAMRLQEQQSAQEPDGDDEQYSFEEE